MEKKHPSSENIKLNLREVRRNKKDLIDQHSTLQEKIEELRQERLSNEAAIEKNDRANQEMRTRNLNINEELVELQSKVAEVDQLIRDLDDRISKVADHLENPSE